MAPTAVTGWRRPGSNATMRSPVPGEAGSCQYAAGTRTRGRRRRDHLLPRLCAPAAAPPRLARGMARRAGWVPPA